MGLAELRRMFTAIPLRTLTVPLLVAFFFGCSVARDHEASIEEGAGDGVGTGDFAGGKADEASGGVDTRALAATEYMLNRVGKHNRYIDISGIGVYYGDKSAYYGLSREGKVAYLDARLSGAWAGRGEDVVDELIPPGCVQWTLEVVDVFFGGGGVESKSEGADPVWRSGVRDATFADALRGTTLARELVAQFDWQAILVTPDFESSSIPEDQREAVRNSQGHADARYLMSAGGTTEGRYPGVAIDRKLARFDTASGALAELNAIPFGILVIKGGFHVGVVYNRDGKLTVSETDRSHGPESKSLFYVEDALEGIVEVYAKTVYDGDYEKAYGFWSDFLVVVPPQYALK
jgi:hypothetical protein